MADAVNIQDVIEFLKTIKTTLVVHPSNEERVKEAIAEVGGEHRFEVKTSPIASEDKIFVMPQPKAIEVQSPIRYSPFYDGTSDLPGHSTHPLGL